MTIASPSAPWQIHSGMDALGVFENRKSDFTLDDEQQSLRHGVASILAKTCTTRQLRDLGSVSFSSSLLGQLAEFGLFAAGLPEELGGAEVGLGSLVAAAEVLGEAFAPVPFADMIAGLRATARAAEPATGLNQLFDGAEPVTVALEDLSRPQTLPAGCVARWVVGWRGDDLVVIQRHATPAWLPNAAGMPLGSWTPGDGSIEFVLNDAGYARRQLVTEWRLLTGAALVGVARTALRYAVDFATVRETRGVPIGALQAISHKLADVKIALDAAGNLIRQAAWFQENEPESRPELPALAFAGAVRAASFGVHTAVHIHGGQGVSLESDVTLAFTRARAWGLFSGHPDRLVADSGASILHRSYEH